jgi:hypothetical protein
MAVSLSQVRGVVWSWPHGFLDALPGEDWLVAHTRPRHEKCLVRDLQRYAIPGVLFLEERMRIRPKSQQRTLVPLLGSYVFVHLPFAQQMRLYDTGRILRLIPVSQPQQLCCDLMDLHRLVTTVPDTLQVTPSLQPGMRVCFRHGTLAGTSGVVVRRDGATLVAVNIHALGHSVTVRVQDDLLEAESA